ncbi:DNA/RNA helicase domain-containing protein [Sphingobacterium micropteri]|nr:DNA/RNA helicase domain-containing protein [Sphingobacterium micropteri]
MDDESRRIREKTGYPFKPTGRLQVEDLLREARISVFFTDDYQAVRRGKIGSSSFICMQAESVSFLKPSIGKDPLSVEDIP